MFSCPISATHTSEHPLPLYVFVFERAFGHVCKYVCPIKCFILIFAKFFLSLFGYGVYILSWLFQYKYSKTDISCFPDFQEFQRFPESSIKVLAVFF